MKPLRTLPLVFLVATTAAAGAMAQQSPQYPSQTEPAAPTQPASPMQQATPMPPAPQSHPALSEPQSTTAPTSQMPPPMPPPMPPANPPPVADRAAPNASMSQGAAEQVTINSQPPPPINPGPAPSFSQLANGKQTIDEEAAAAYPLLANDFAYVDKNRDGRITKSEYERWAKHDK